SKPPAGFWRPQDARNSANNSERRHTVLARKQCRGNGLENELVPINYEFIPEANQMLRVCRKTKVR
ncbi:MAG TPA: hypothetical protein VE154_04075, partial [Chthoniobacterales bacterium]|nr:hypothetical protein [Chthoniobacterales bacterium]